MHRGNFLLNARSSPRQQVATELVVPGRVVRGCEAGVELQAEGPLLVRLLARGLLLVLAVGALLSAWAACRLLLTHLMVPLLSRPSLVLAAALAALPAYIALRVAIRYATEEPDDVDEQ